MTSDQLRELTTTRAQADVVLERASALGCWPDDLIVEADGPLRVNVTVGLSKGRAKFFSVDAAGKVQMRTAGDLMPPSR